MARQNIPASAETKDKKRSSMRALCSSYRKLFGWHTAIAASAMTSSDIVARQELAEQPTKGQLFGNPQGNGGGIS